VRHTWHKELKLNAPPYTFTYNAPSKKWHFIKNFALIIQHLITLMVYYSWLSAKCVTEKNSFWTTL